MRKSPIFVRDPWPGRKRPMSRRRRPSARGGLGKGASVRSPGHAVMGEARQAGSNGQTPEIPPRSLSSESRKQPPAMYLRRDPPPAPWDGREAERLSLARSMQKAGRLGETARPASRCFGIVLADHFSGSLIVWPTLNRSGAETWSLLSSYTSRQRLPSPNSLSAILQNESPDFTV